MRDNQLDSLDKARKFVGDICEKYGLDVQYEVHDHNGFDQLDCAIFFLESTAKISFNLDKGKMLTGMEDVECDMRELDFWREVAFDLA